MNAKLMSGNGKDYDLVQAGDSKVANLIKQNYIEELDFNNIPNVKVFDGNCPRKSLLKTIC